MNTEKMNVHKALCELKILDDRIEKAIKDCAFVGVKKVAAKMVGAQTVEEFSATEKAKFDKTLDLMKRREAIKRAVVLSNAVTKVNVGGTEYTVAEAIELKNHGLDDKKDLRDRLSHCLRFAENGVTTSNNEADRRADMHVQGITNGKDVNATDVKMIRDGYLAGMVVEMVDPLPGGARKILEKLEDEISTFEIEVDAALSTSNALTEITVEY